MYFDMIVYLVYLSDINDVLAKEAYINITNLIKDILSILITKQSFDILGLK